MTSLWFLVPAHERLRISAVCFRQLRRTCDALVAAGVAASAVVIAEDENLDLAREQGFGTIERENRPLGRKWNDGYEAAGLAGVDFVVPLGSDDWVDPALIIGQLDMDGEIRCSRQSAIVSEDGRRLSRLNIGYDGGDGVRVIPTGLLERVGFRPADDDRFRAMDAAVTRGITLMLGRMPRFTYLDLHPIQIVDFKSSEGQLNPYEGCRSFADGGETDPWPLLAEHYPDEALAEARAVYGLTEVAA